MEKLTIRRMDNGRKGQLEECLIGRWHNWHIRQLEDNKRNKTIGRKHNWNMILLEENIEKHLEMPRNQIFTIQF